MSELTLMDVVVLLLLTASMPLLVDNYLKAGRFSAGVKFAIILGGLLWLVFAFFAEPLSRDLLGVPMYDAWGHMLNAENLALSMNQGSWAPFWEHFRTGNHAYQCYVVLIMWLGASVYSVQMLNAWFCFWGGLILASRFSSVCPYATNRNLWLYVTVFLPSVVFWGTQNLKEGLMFWSICCILSSAFPERGNAFSLRSPLVLAAIAVGGVLRPHVTMGWVISVAAVSIFASGRRTLAAVMFLILPLLAISLRQLTGAGLSTESFTDLAETHFANLAHIQGQGSGIEYMSGNPIFFVSGFISAFFRPFPWKITSTRLLMSVIETWALTLTLAWIWIKYGSSYGSLALRMPAVRAAILGIVWMCILLSYFPNEGLMIRQKVQMMPGLLTLVIVPFLLKEAARQRVVFQRAFFNGSLSSAYTGPKSG